MNQINYLILSISLIAWSVLHSALISNKFILFANIRFGEKIKYYRVIYNIISMVTLCPIIIYSFSIQGEYIFIWSGSLQVVQGLVFIIAILLFYTGAKHYDALQFLGIRQITDNSHSKSLTDDGNLDMSGILNMVRHPWYFAAILVLWIRDINISALIVNIIFTLYLIIGTYLEERKLVTEFGDKYRLYQKNVSMLFPYKWLKSKLF